MGTHSFVARFRTRMAPNVHCSHESVVVFVSNLIYFDKGNVWLNAACRLGKAYL